MNTCKKKLLAIMLTAVLALSLAAIHAFAEEVTSLSGLGTEESPYLIYTEEELIAVSLGKIESPCKSYYSLQNDIEITADTWSPIGNTDATAFQGVFDGNGHKISSTVLFQSTGMSGIFGINKGTIKNLRVEVTIIDIATNAGALVATNSGTIENCYAAGSLAASGNYKIGGLVGYNTGLVYNCGSDVSINAPSSTVGGLVGYNYRTGVIEYSYSTSDEIIGNVAGGLVGEQYANNNKTTKILNSFSLSKVTGGSYGGGLIGYNHYSDGYTYVEFCYAVGIIASGTNNGGLFGKIGSSYDGHNVYKYNYYNKTNTGNKYGFPVSVSAMKKQDTFYGWNFDNVWSIDSTKNGGYPYINLRGTEKITISGIGTADDPYVIETEEQLFAMNAKKLDNALSSHYILANDIEVTANFYTPIGIWTAFSGVFDGNGHTISGLTLSGTDYANTGLFAYNSGTVKNLTVSDVNFSGNTNTAAIVAYNYSAGVVENCTVTEGDGTTLSGTYTGGMVAINYGTVRLCGVECDVISDGSTVGGLVARNNKGGLIEYCWSWGDITGNIAGGLVGEQYATDNSYAATRNSYSMGKVTGTKYAGGLVGYDHYSDGTTYVLYCYSRGLIVSTSTSGGLIGHLGTAYSGYNVVRYSYYNMNNNGNKIGFSISASSMKKQSTFYGWDFENIWTIDKEVNNGYPSINIRGTTPTIVLEGTGDEDDPYVIHNEKELRALVLDSGDYKLSVKNHYILANDIAVTADHWTPIGSNGTDAFNGIFDGDGYTISGIKLSNSYYDYIGLFGTNTGTIKNLNVVGDIEGVNYAGIVTASNSGTIENCTSSGTVVNVTANKYAGGITGYNTGTITLCGSDAMVGNSNNIAGGLVGTNRKSGLIQYSYAKGSVSGIYAGGLVGEQYATDNKTAIIRNSYSMGEVTSTKYTGGLVGYDHYSDGTTYVEYCYTTSVVSGGTSGGLVGAFGTSYDGYNHVRYSYYNNYNTGNEIGFALPLTAMTLQNEFYMWNFKNIWTISPSENGGYPYIDLRGKIKAHELDGYGDSDDPYMIETEEDLWALVDGTYNLNSKYCYQLQNDIEITANYWTPIGSNGMEAFNGIFDGNGYTISGLKTSNVFYGSTGLFGNVTGTVKNLHVIVNFDGNQTVGAITAFNSGIIDNCSSEGVIVSDNSDDYKVGGIVGDNSGTITNSHSYASVTAPNGGVGGIAGRNNNGVIDKCYATGNISGKCSGGIVGSQYSNNNKTSKISNSYATGEVYGSKYAGGLSGYNHFSDGTTYVEYCYSNSRVKGDSSIGGLVGKLGSAYSGSNNVVSSFYNSTLSGMTDINRGTPLDDNQMKQQAQFAGWDFTSIWSIGETVNNGYPYLTASAPEDIVNVTSVVLNANEKQVENGDSFTLTATVLPANATNKSVIWTSSDTNILTVANGTVNAHAAGTATITVTTAEGGFTASCTVTVTEVDTTVHVVAVALNKTTATLEIGNSTALVVTIAPSSATNKDVTWDSSDTSVATVSNGVVIAKAAGTAIITVTTVDGGFTATCTVTVNAAPVTPPEPTVTLGDVNADGDIDFVDAMLVLKYDVGSENLSEDQLMMADVSKDGDVDFVDAILILKYDCGLISSFN